MEALFFQSRNISIYLDHNKISKISFDRKFLQEKEPLFESKMHVHLSFNPIQCNCEISSLLEYMNNTQDIVNKYYDFKTEDFYCYKFRDSNPTKVFELYRRTYTCEIEFLNLTSNGICGGNSKCDCKYRPTDDKLMINCSSRNLNSLPETQWNFTASKIELYLQNNHFKEIPSMQEVGYEKISLLDLSNNLITDWNENILSLNNNTVGYRRNYC